MSKEGCIQALGSLNSHGYGRISIGDIQYGAHVISYRLFKGLIPRDKEIDHTCRNRACINPNHLRLLTHKENTLIGVGPCAKHAQKTHCFRGHLFNEENTYISKNNKNHRRCRICLRILQKNWIRAKREKNKQSKAEGRE